MAKVVRASLHIGGSSNSTQQESDPIIELPLPSRITSRGKPSFKASFAESQSTFPKATEGLVSAAISFEAADGDGIRSSSSTPATSWARSQAHELHRIVENLDGLKASLCTVQQSLQAFAESGLVQLGGGLSRFDDGQTLLVSSESSVSRQIPDKGYSLSMVPPSPSFQSYGLPPRSGPTTPSAAGNDMVDGKDTDRFVAEALPLDWPRSLNMRAGMESLQKHSSINRSISKSQRSRIADRLDTSSIASADAEFKPRVSPFRATSPVKESRPTQARKFFSTLAFFLRKMRDPESRFQVAWKSINAMVLLYEAILVPYLLGFSIEFQGWVVEQLLFMALFWTVDLCLNFIQGYEKDGVVITDIKLAVQHYLKTAFPLDVLVVILDWSTLLIIWANTGQFNTVARVLRLARMAGLLRLQKLANMVVFHIFAADIDGLHSIGGLVAMIIGCVVLFNHLQVCTWAYIGWNAPSDTGSHWVDMHLLVGDGERLFEDLNPTYQYTCIFHWYMAQLTVGNQEIRASSSLERIVNIILLLIALMIACTVVSMLSATLVGFQFSVRQRTQQLRVLEAYLKENNVSQRMKASALKQAKERIRKSAKLHEKDVQILGLLSTSLRTELCYEIATPYLQAHPLLHLWARLDTISAMHLSVVATSFEIVLPHEMLFQAAEEATKACYICSGKGEYRQYPRSFRCEMEQAVQVGQRVWLSEAVLWAEWIHVGSFEAWTPLEIFKLNVQQWTSALPAAHTSREVVTDYAVQFYRRLVNAAPPLAPWPDDLGVPYTDYGELICAMTRSSQEIIGMEGLVEAQQARKLPDTTLQKLETQLLDGKCVLYLDNGQLKRVTSGVSLLVEGQPGRFLYQVGKMKDEQVSMSMMVPGHMSERDELPVDSVKRLLGSKLQPLVGHVHLYEAESEVETKMSVDFGVLTDYMQLKFSGALDGRFDIPGQYRVGDANLAVHSRGTTTSAGAVGSIDLAALPETFMFPGEKKNSGYFFAWLSPMEFKSLQGRKSFVTKWLSCASQEFKRSQGQRLHNIGDSAVLSPFSGTATPTVSQLAGAAGLQLGLNIADSQDASKSLPATIDGDPITWL